MKHYTLPLGFLFFFCTISYSQISPLAYQQDNYLNLLPQKTYPADAGKKYNSEKDLQHPDFGKLTFDAPLGKRVVEVLSKRKIDERFYIDLDNPLFFYIEKASKPINFYKNGYLIAIDPAFYSSANGIYKAENQPCPTELNTLTKSSGITLGSGYFGFNDFSLKIIKNDNSVQVLTSDWSKIAVGNNGAYITDVFPGIDMKIMYREHSVKSEFIIKQQLHVKQLIFIDHLKTSANLSLQMEVPISSGGKEKGHLLVFDNQSNEQVAEMDPPRSHDNSGTKTLWFNSCTLNGNQLEIGCDSVVLNSLQTVYPVTVDPLVTAVGPIVAGTTYLMGSLLSPAICSNVIAVTFPGGTTPWDVSAGWQVYSDWCYANFVDCWRSEAQVYITTTCGGRSPVSPTIWTCSPGCNSYGTWNPTLPFASSGTQSLAQCYTASCAAQTMNFTFNLNRTYCSTYPPNYDACTPAARSYCQTLDNWRVTVQGRSEETLGNTTTGNGSTTAAPICFTTATLNPTAQYGVGPYSYNWNPGGQTTNTKTVFANYIGTQTFTCTVTDACGTVRTAAFSVTPNCVLPVQLLQFSATPDGRNVNLNWETASETNSSHFTIERSYDGVNFTQVATVKAAGNSSANILYRATDVQVDRNKIVYYRLKQFDNGRNEEVYSSLIDVEPDSEKSISVFPNPGNGSYEVIPQGNYSDLSYSIQVHDNMGKEVYTASELKNASAIDLTAYPSGIYSVKVMINGTLVAKNIIKQ